MPPHEFKTVRKLQEQGGSLLVTLPKIWCRAEELEEGDEVLIFYDGELRIQSNDQNKGPSGLRPTRSRSTHPVAPEADRP